MPELRQRYAPAEQSSCGNPTREYQSDTAVEYKTRQHDRPTRTGTQPAAPTKEVGSRSPLPLDKPSYISVGGVDHIKSYDLQSSLSPGPIRQQHDQPRRVADN